MGWENETGRMDYKFFWGRMLSAVAKSHKKTARTRKACIIMPHPETRKVTSFLARDEIFLCAPRTHAQGATNHKQLLSAPRHVHLWCLR